MSSNNFFPSSPRSCIKFAATVLLISGISRNAHAAIKTGDAFPSPSASGLEGRAIPVATGKVMWVDLSSRCAPCRELFPRGERGERPGQADVRDKDRRLRLMKIHSRRVLPAIREKAAFADYALRPDRDPVTTATSEHIFTSREATCGGRGVGGSGCGCN